MDWLKDDKQDGINVFVKVIWSWKEWWQVKQTQRRKEKLQQQQQQKEIRENIYQSKTGSEQTGNAETRNKKRKSKTNGQQYYDR